MGGEVQTFLDGSVDHFIYWDYIVNRNSFIYRSLACVPALTLFAASAMHEGLCETGHVLSVSLPPPLGHF